MQVLFVSQCSQNALKETRRILDQFAERCGERTWTTPITWQGLETIRKLLKQTARKNTAVACHLIKNHRSELLWIVGSLVKFSDEGIVPTNTTERNLLRVSDENSWNTAEDVLLLSAIAALFHDFGKASNIFQAKLAGSISDQSKKIEQEPCRHEWVSLKLFQAFVDGDSDKEWLEKLASLKEEDPPVNLSGKRFKELTNSTESPLGAISHLPLAQAVGWLILTHHRLPYWPGKRVHGNQPSIRDIDEWLEKELRASWNSLRDKPDEEKKKWPFKFEEGLPWKSALWRRKAKNIADRALKRPQLIRNWIEDPFSLHLARMVLMLGDHSYSSRQPNSSNHDSRYPVYANTGFQGKDKNKREFKQSLDEHLLGVTASSIWFARRIPSLKTELPAISRHRAFKKRTSDSRFLWQNKAYELAHGVKERSLEHGFFGVNMASTGCGKTFANARIMYGLSSDKLGCRFNIALGLRTLTLQTADALREKTSLEPEDIAVLVGSSAVRELYKLDQAERKESRSYSGSDSTEALIDESQYVRYEGTLADSALGEWLSERPDLYKLISAPILVSTIDYLMPATEGQKGGKQIAPMLRLLTSDLVLDEPDDFNLEDLPGLSRLVHWTGMLGSRVLISSATLPPDFVQALFEAYLSGRKIFQNAVGVPGRELNVVCAWFDEYRVVQNSHGRLDSFKTHHDEFIKFRVENLLKKETLHRGDILQVKISSSPIEELKNAFYGGMLRLHDQHANSQAQSQKRVSIGLVRMANISPLVAVAKQLLKTSPPEDYRIHLCVYHARYPLAVRSEIERCLDQTLTRHDPESIWNDLRIQKALHTYPERNHIFVVFATSVAEVGRDHDYDWAIAEPSSMRSLIQLSGRVQRHRHKIPNGPNILILSRNYKAVNREKLVFVKPGFESSKFKLSSHDLNDILEPCEFQKINSIPRIQRIQLAEGDWKESLVKLEHAHLSARLWGTFGVYEHASLWWKHRAHWCYEIQSRLPFRTSYPQEEFVLMLEEEGAVPSFHRIEEDGSLTPQDALFKKTPIKLADRVSFWMDIDFQDIMRRLSVSTKADFQETCYRFGRFSVPRKALPEFFYHPHLGIHEQLTQ